VSQMQKQANRSDVSNGEMRESAVSGVPLGVLEKARTEWFALNVVRRISE
jgi:hypothetical protein